MLKFHVKKLHSKRKSDKEKEKEKLIKKLEIIIRDS